MQHINLIHENCETFNGEDELISENAHEVSGTLLALIQKSEQHHDSGSSGGGAGSGGDTVGGGDGGGGCAENDSENSPPQVCAACGERILGSGALVSCDACGALHHAMCVLAGGAAGGVQEVPWMCLACGWANN